MSSRFAAMHWTVVAPVLAAVVLIASWGTKPATGVLVLIAGFLAGSVLAAVHHAEVVAHRVGEPFGSLVLAVAVTVIEVALIVTLMLSGGSETATLARDTVFAAAMITCNGIVGLSVLVGALHRRVASFNAEGHGQRPRDRVHPCDAQPRAADVHHQQVRRAVLAGAARVRGRGVDRALCAVVVVQTVRHRDYFLPADVLVEDHAAPPSGRQAAASLGLLIVALIAVVGLAKIESPAIEDAVGAIGAPQSAVGVVIALLVLTPETLAAGRNARRDRVQTSLNLAFGSAMASIGLTIPAIAIASIWLDGPLVLGLGPTQMVLLAITAVVGALTVLPGRATIQEGGVHLVLFGAFLFLAVIP